MSFKKNIIKNQLKEEEIFEIISHCPGKYIKLITINSIIITVLYYLYKMSLVVVSGEILKYIFSTFAVFFYIRFVIKFLDIFLDCIVIIPNGIIIYKWDGLLKSSTEHIQRSSIDSIHGEQSGLLDMVLGKGDLKLSVEENSFVFDNISDPAQKAQILRTHRDNELIEEQTKEEIEEEIPDKFDILVETLGEVILDYVKKNN